MNRSDISRAGAIGSRWNLRERLSRPETVIALIVTCGFLTNVQQGTDTNAILRSDPWVFKGIRILTVATAELLAISVLVRRRTPHTVLQMSAVLPFTLYFCSCILSVPFSAYPMLSLFKASEIGLVVLLCILGMTSAGGAPADFFHLNMKIVLLYNVIIWVEGLLFPHLAWIKLSGQTPLFGHALSGVFPVINGNTVGLFGAVLALAYLPRLWEPGLRGLCHVPVVLMGWASVVCSYSRSSLIGLVVAVACSLVLLRKYALGWALILCVALVATSGKVQTLLLEHLARGQEDRSLDTFSSNRLEMWSHMLGAYRTSVVGRGYAAGFRYDEDLAVGHAHNSLFELYFNVGLIGVAAWLLLMGTVCSRLYYLWRTRVTIDPPLVAIVGVMVFLLVKATASTVFVYLDASMLILAGIVIYIEKRLAATEFSGTMMSNDYDLSWAS